MSHAIVIMLLLLASCGGAEKIKPGSQVDQQYRVILKTSEINSVDSSTRKSVTKVGARELEGDEVTVTKQTGGLGLSGGGGM